jgi:hypothetical protein
MAEVHDDDAIAGGEQLPAEAAEPRPESVGEQHAQIVRPRPSDRENEIGGDGGGSNRRRHADEDRRNHRRPGEGIEAVAIDQQHRGQERAERALSNRDRAIEEGVLLRHQQRLVNRERITQRRRDHEDGERLRDQRAVGRAEEHPG